MKFKKGDSVQASRDLPYPDRTIKAGTSGVVTGVFGLQRFYLVDFVGDSEHRMTQEADLKRS